MMVRRCFHKLRGVCTVGVSLTLCPIDGVAACRIEKRPRPPGIPGARLRNVTNKECHVLRLVLRLVGGSFSSSSLILCM